MSQALKQTMREDRAQWEALMSEYESGDLLQRPFCEQHAVA